MFKLHRYTIHCNGCESEMERIVLVSLHVFFLRGVAVLLLLLVFNTQTGSCYQIFLKDFKLKQMRTKLSKHCIVSAAGTNNEKCSDTLFSGALESLTSTASLDRLRWNQQSGKM